MNVGNAFACIHSPFLVGRLREKIDSYQAFIA